MIAGLVILQLYIGTNLDKGVWVCLNTRGNPKIEQFVQTMFWNLIHFEPNCMVWYMQLLLYRVKYD